MLSRAAAFPPGFVSAAASPPPGRPEDLLLGVIPVPPVAIRPSVEMDGASNEDDITMKLMVRMRGRRSNLATNSWLACLHN
jgi:DNA-directed RNA polymerase beta' subunit